MKGSDYMRMTREEMKQHYPEQWLGLKDAVYPEDDDVNFISAEVVYTGESKFQLLDRQLINKEPIFTWYTGMGTEWPLGGLCSKVVIYEKNADGQDIKIAELM